jgi:hypothetical protein
MRRNFCERAASTMALEAREHIATSSAIKMSRADHSSIGRTRAAARDAHDFAML